VTVTIGITGPIGCGKSTVAGWLGDLGAFVIDADAVAHEVTAPGTPALTAIAARFGAGYLRPDGSLDGAALGRVVFADPAALEDLEAIVHPAVRARIHEVLTARAQDHVGVTVIEAIRLAEGGLADWCDEVWLVTCDRDVQRRRLIGRGMPPADVDQRIAAQTGLAARARPKATRIIDTSDDREATRQQVIAAWRELRLE
jgi:dephospho-CoA kinase